MYRDSVYIVTGCTGYVGNVLTKKLLDDGCRVIGFARSEEKWERVFKDKKPQAVFGDVSKQEDVERLFSCAPEGAVVLHTVAKVTIGEGTQKELYDVTVTGTRLVVQACLAHKAKKLLHISSTEAMPHDFLPKEDLSDYVPDPARAKRGYARAKSSADKIVLDAVKREGLDASLLLFAGVLGPGDYSKSHMTQMFIDYMEGHLPASVKGGYNDFDIRDVADVLPAIVEKSQAGESYLFAHKPDTIHEILEIISKVTGAKKLPALPLWLAYVGIPFFTLASKISGKRPLYTAAALGSLKAKTNFPIEKAVKQFGYSPRPLEETVTDHVRFLIENGMVRV